jgi:hypothetical protein
MVKWLRKRGTQGTNFLSTYQCEMYHVKLGSLQNRDRAYDVNVLMLKY